MRHLLACSLPASLVLGLAGCGKITLEKLHEKNRATINAAVNGFAEMDKIIKASPKPAANGVCAKEGLKLVPNFSIGRLQGTMPSGDGVTELVDASALLKTEKLPGRFGGVEGPLAGVVSEKFFSLTEPSFKVTEKDSQVIYDAATRVKQVIVVRAQGVGEAPATAADVYLFEYPTVKLVCSFSLDTSGDQAFAKENGYDPKTGEPSGNTFQGAPTSLLPLFAGEMQKRFAISLPGESSQGGAQTVLAEDDPRVRARAQAVSKQFESLPEDLAACEKSTVSSTVRLNRKRLQVIAGSGFLTKNTPIGTFDSNVEIDPNVSAVVRAYLLTRDKGAANKLAAATSWAIVDVQRGTDAYSLDGASFGGGSASGRLVIFDADSKPKCQMPFDISPPEHFDAKVHQAGASGWTSSNVGEVSHKYLLEQIDSTFGPPP